MILWIASAGFEVACIYAWATFMLTLVHDRPYPLLQAIAAFGCGSLAARWLRSSERVLGHVLGVLALWWLAVSCDTGLHTLALGVLLGWSGVFWFAGARHGREAPRYDTLLRRFERAVGWLAELFVVKILLRLLPKPGVNMSDDIGGAHVAAFFVFAVVALVCARGQGDARTSYIGEAHGPVRMGPLLGSGAAVALCAVAVVLLFLPQLRAAAQAGVGLLSPLAGPLSSLFTLLVAAFFAVMQFLMGPSFTPPPRKNPPDMGQLPPDAPQDTTWLQTSHGSDLWLPLTAAALGALLLAAIVWVVLRRRSRMRRSWQRRVWFARDERPEALRLYRKLEAWGRRSGVVARPHETPLEYSARLQRHLPRTRSEIDAIVAAINLQLYAPASQPLLTLDLARSALRRLCSPRLWPQRFKLRLFGGLS